jgi:hypothetical protein
VAVPDAVEPVVAWRAWFLTRRGTGGRIRLDSVIHACLWPARLPLVARCWGEPACDHDAPAAACRCGIHGSGEVQGLVHYLGYGSFPATRLRAVGLVSLWGDVVEHERGWRASHAYPYHLWLPVQSLGDGTVDGWRPTALDLADYGVPVEVVEASGVEDLASTLEAWERRTLRRAA